ncbi:hypothetical protein [Rhodoferax antarcticus]|uniref:Uncharacterized protein n=1 Tax=Rhodoferax antarcticus ANT.BR TaxID=1111071 RepID=A0A1Q8YDF2_9BURK|nr:hypothetical protein [Rhodoferax antarcticus]APW45956.1 hypothetical protein RA876_05735 [Rhodoferax antarcticus]OLP06076.1 hypothetical protein BLL52_2306 [Rhodoferax antarcticus ANT.BR]
MNKPHLTPKPAPSAAVHTPVETAHAGHRYGGHIHDEDSHNEHSRGAPGYDSHSQSHPTHAAHALAEGTSANPALLNAPLITSVLGWPAWLRVLAVLPVLLLLWLAVAWASAEVTPW